VAAALLSAGAAVAQQAPEPGRMVVKLSLSRLLTSTYEVEAEYRLTPRVSLTVAPRVVTGPVASFVSATASAAGDRVSGAGLGLGSRLYLSKAGASDFPLAGLYVAARAEFQRLNVAYKREAWGEEQGRDGLMYYTFRPRDLRENITRWGGAGLLGYQAQAFHSRMRLDVSVGLMGLRSTSSEGKASQRDFLMTDYAYSGVMPAANLSIGYVWK
jgi:hypothetical protein